MKEIWKNVVGFRGRYQVSNLGRVREGKVFRPLGQNADGYVLVALKTASGKYISHYAHKLVMRAFVGLRPKGRQIAHLDGIKSNNRLNNLAYKTQKQNWADRHLHGTASNGSNGLMIKLATADIHQIRKKLTLGQSKASIAREHGVTTAAVRNIFYGRTWSHVP